MKNLIDESYFWGELKLAGIESLMDGSAQSSYDSKRANELTQFIVKYQKRFIRLMFGKPISDDILNYPELTALLVDTEARTSPIANYVYYMWNLRDISIPTIAGEKKISVTNTYPTSQILKMIRAWNEMVLRVIEIHTDLYELDDLVYVHSTLDYEDDILQYVDFEGGIIFNYINTFGF